MSKLSPTLALPIISSLCERPLSQVIVVLPSNRKDRYDSIKKLCCVELPVPSQCILQRTLSKKQNLMSVATKVAMQLNCKLGGELWAVEVPVSISLSLYVSLSFCLYFLWCSTQRDRN